MSYYFGLYTYTSTSRKNYFSSKLTESNQVNANRVHTNNLRSKKILFSFKKIYWKMLIHIRLGTKFSKTFLPILNFSFKSKYIKHIKLVFIFHKFIFLLAFDSNIYKTQRKTPFLILKVFVIHHLCSQEIHPTQDFFNVFIHLFK